MTVRTLSDLVFRVREISSGRSDLLSFHSEERREALSTADFLRGIHSLLLALEIRGLSLGDRVAIFSDNRPEWHVVDFACQLLGVQSVPIPTGLSPQQVGFILRNSACRWVFYDTSDRCELLRSLESTLTNPPALAAFVADAATPSGVTITRLMGEGAARQGDVPIERYRGLVEEGDPASLVYSGGTTGELERRLLSHRDLMSLALERGPACELSPSDRALSCLSLAGGLQRSIDPLCFYRGVAIHYLSSPGGVLEALGRERSSLLSASPKVYEQLRRRMVEIFRLESPLRRYLFRWATDVVERHQALRLDGMVGPVLALQRKAAWQLVFRNIHQRLGGRLRCAIVGGPTLHGEANRFLEGMGVIVSHQG